MLGFQEALIVVVVVAALGFFVVPFIGIRTANKRLKAKRRSTAAVVVASFGATVMVGAGLSGRLNWFFCLLGALLNLVWLLSAVMANRRAARQAPSTRPTIADSL